MQKTQCRSGFYQLAGVCRQKMVNVIGKNWYYQCLVLSFFTVFQNIRQIVLLFIVVTLGLYLIKPCCQNGHLPYENLYWLKGSLNSCEKKVWCLWSEWFECLSQNIYFVNTDQKILKTLVKTQLISSWSLGLIWCNWKNACVYVFLCIVCAIFVL